MQDIRKKKDPEGCKALAGQPEVLHRNSTAGIRRVRKDWSTFEAAAPLS